MIVSRLRRQSPAAKILGVTGLLVACGLLHVALHIQVIQTGYELSRETRLRHELEDQNQKLRLERAVRRDPAVVERRAREELRMTPPDPTAIRIVALPSDGRAAAPAAPGLAPVAAVARR